MSPEYAIDGKFSVNSDVFSLGVLLVEIVSGQRNRGFHHPDHHHSLLGQVSASNNTINYIYMWPEKLKMQLGFSRMIKTSQQAVSQPDLTNTEHQQNDKGRQQIIPVWIHQHFYSIGLEPTWL